MNIRTVIGVLGGAAVLAGVAALALLLKPPAGDAVPAGRDLFGAPITADSQPQRREPGVEEPMPPNREGGFIPHSEDLFIGPRQPWEPPEIMAYS